MVRASNPGCGGIAVLHRRRVRTKKLNLPVSKTFEGLCLKVRSGIVMTSSYCPCIALDLCDRVTPQFYDELSTVLESLVTQSCPVITCDDFNIHVEDTADHNSSRFVELVNSFDLIQHVKQPTHQHGGTLKVKVKSEE